MARHARPFKLEVVREVIIPAPPASAKSATQAIATQPQQGPAAASGTVLTSGSQRRYEKIDTANHHGD